MLSTWAGFRSSAYGTVTPVSLALLRRRAPTLISAAARAHLIEKLLRDYLNKPGANLDRPILITVSSPRAAPATLEYYMARTTLGCVEKFQNQLSSHFNKTAFFFNKTAFFERREAFFESLTWPNVPPASSSLIFSRSRSVTATVNFRAGVQQLKLCGAIKLNCTAIKNRITLG